MMIINRNPAKNSEIVSQHEISTTAELDKMLAKSTEAFKSWKLVPAPKRAEYLLKAANIYRARKKELSETLHRENGKPIEEAEGEIQEVIDTFEFFAGEGRRIYGMTGQSEMPGKSIITVREPIGPAVFITAWNFPAAVPSWKAAPCLVSGNTFILKPSELAPLSGKILVDILNETGLPEGVAQVAMGAGDVGSYLIKSPASKIVSVTGSTETGREVATIAAANFKKCALELGGKNAAIVLADADLELVTEGLVWGAYGTAGQRCTSTSRLIIDSKVSKAVVDGLKSKISKLGTSRSYTPIISYKQLVKIDALVKEAIAEGAELICGGEILKHGDRGANPLIEAKSTDEKLAGSNDGYYYAPTILKIKPEMKIARTEVFGPVLSVIEIDAKNFQSKENSKTPHNEAEAILKEALRIANSTDYGLSSSIYTRDINLAMQSASAFESGLVYINAPTIGAECGGASLFGGWKNTGNGSREGGITALDTYTQYKTIAIDYSGRLQRAQID